RQVLIQKMESGLAEAIVGYRDDPVVGPLVMVGAGGILAELYNDVVLRLAPVDEAEALEMIGQVKGFAVLRGFRGLPRGDVQALAQMDQSGVTPAESARDVAEHADIIFLSLPGGTEVNAVCLGAGSLLTHLKPGGLVVDLSTTPVNLARDLNARFTARGIQFA